MHRPQLDFWRSFQKKDLLFLNKQYEDWSVRQPLRGVSILHNTPLDMKTLVKVDCLISAGAKVTLTRTKFIRPSAEPETYAYIPQMNLEYIPEHQDLLGRSFDLVLDCGQECLDIVHARRGIVEMTGSGTHILKNLKSQNFPVMSVDDSKIKCLETFLGTADGFVRALKTYCPLPIEGLSVILFGYGKVGKGIASTLRTLGANVFIADADERAIQACHSHEFKGCLASDKQELLTRLKDAQLVIAAVGITGAITHLIGSECLNGKILASISAEDDFGNTISEHSVLGKKQPLNFLLDDPTHMRYMDPNFAAHNLAAELILTENLSPVYHPFPTNLDQNMLGQWKTQHGEDLREIGIS